MAAGRILFVVYSEIDDDTYRIISARRAENHEETAYYRAILGRYDKGNTDWAHVDNMTEEEVHQAALADPDAQPTTLDDWKDAVVHVTGADRR